MLIKFLKSGTGDPKLAAAYVTGEQDHQGDRRAGVKILRGDPATFAIIAESIKFQYCYTSAVIAWSPEDHVSDAQLEEVLDLFEEHAFAGLSPEQYHMTAVMHAEDDGSRHLHILVPRIELNSGKSLNIAPPGHHHYFDPLRDFLNHKYGWARPDDPTRIKSIKLKNHHEMQNAAAIKAGMQHLPKKTRLELIHQYVEQRIVYGIINNRDDLLKSLSELGELSRKHDHYISLKTSYGTDRLKGKFYHAEFSFDAYRKNRAGPEAARAVLPGHPAGLAAPSAELTECLKRLEQVRRKRFTYHQKYYRTGIPATGESLEPLSGLSAAPGATVKAKLGRNPDYRSGIDVVQHQNRHPVSGHSEATSAPTENLAKSTDRFEQEQGITRPDTAEQRARATEQQCTTQRPSQHDAIAETNTAAMPQQQLSSEISRTVKPSAWRWNQLDTAAPSAMQKNTVVSWDIRHIQHAVTAQGFYLNIGVQHDRNIVTNPKKPVDSPAKGHDSSFGTQNGSTSGGSPALPAGLRSPKSIHRRTHEVTKASERLSGAYAQRKHSYDEEAERYEAETNRERQDPQALSRRNQERDILQRTNRFFNGIWARIRATFKTVIDQLTPSPTDTGRTPEQFKTVSKRLETVGIDRLVNLARRRAEHRKLIEHVRRVKAEIEASNQPKNDPLVIKTISAELKKMKIRYTDLYLDDAYIYANKAEGCFHDLCDPNIAPESKKMDMEGYIHFIEECLNEFRVQLPRMNTGETEGFEKLMTVVELHIKELNTTNLEIGPTIDLNEAQQYLGDMVQDVREKLAQRLTELSEDSHLDHQNDAVLSPRESEPTRSSSSDYDAYF